MTLLAWLNGPRAPIPAFILSSFRMGPLTTTMRANDVVEVYREGTPVEARARITGRCSGRAPAITALTATLSTS